MNDADALSAVDVDTLLRFYDTSYFDGKLADRVKLSWVQTAVDQSARDTDGYIYCSHAAVVPPWWTGPSWQLAIGFKQLWVAGAVKVSLRLPVVLRSAKLTDATKSALLHALEHVYLLLSSGDADIAHSARFQRLDLRLERAAVLDPFRPPLGYASDTKGLSETARAVDAALRAVQQARANLTASHYALLRLLACICGCNSWLPTLAVDVIAFEACLCGALPLWRFAPETVALSGRALRMHVSHALRDALDDLVEAQFTRKLRYLPRGSSYALTTAVCVSSDGVISLHNVEAQAMLLDHRLLTCMDSFCYGRAGVHIADTSRPSLKVELSRGTFRIRWSDDSVLLSSVTHMPFPSINISSEPRVLNARQSSVDVQSSHAGPRCAVFVCEWLPLGTAALDATAQRLDARYGRRQHAMQRISPYEASPTSCSVLSYSPGHHLVLNLERHIMDRGVAHGILQLGCRLSAHGDVEYGAELGSLGDVSQQQHVSDALLAAAATTLHDEGQTALDACLTHDTARMTRALHGSSDWPGGRPAYRVFLVSAGASNSPPLDALASLLGDVLDEVDVLNGARCIVGRLGMLVFGSSVDELQPALAIIGAARARMLAIDTVYSSMVRCLDDVQKLKLVATSSAPVTLMRVGLSHLSSRAADLNVALQMLVSAASRAQLVPSTLAGAEDAAGKQLLNICRTAAMERALLSRTLDCTRMISIIITAIRVKRQQVDALNYRQLARGNEHLASHMRSWSSQMRRSLRLLNNVSSIVFAVCGLLSCALMDRFAGGSAELSRNTDWLRALLLTAGAQSSAGAPPWTAISLCVAAACAALTLMPLHFARHFSLGSVSIVARLGGRHVAVWRLQAMLRSDAGTESTKHARWSRRVSRRGDVRDSLRWRCNSGVAELLIHPRAGQASTISIEKRGIRPGRRVLPLPMLEAFESAMAARGVWASKEDSKRLSSIGTVPWGWPARGMPLANLQGALIIQACPHVDGLRIMLAQPVRQVALHVLTFVALRSAVAAKFAVEPEQVVHLTSYAARGTALELEDDAAVMLLHPGSLVVVHLTGRHPAPALAARQQRAALLRDAERRGARTRLVNI